MNKSEPVSIQFNFNVGPKRKISLDFHHTNYYHREFFKTLECFQIMQFLNYNIEQVDVILENY